MPTREQVNTDTAQILSSKQLSAPLVAAGTATADPVLPLGLATKQYVEGKSGANTYGSRGLVGAATGATSINVTAESVILLNPTTGATLVFKNVTTITNTITTAGPVANGRDQAAAFSPNSWIYLYFISDGAQIQTITSAVPPPTGPTLPPGYTSWCLATAVRLNAGTTIQFFQVRGSWTDYSGFQACLTGGTATGETPVSLVAFMPPNAYAVKLNIRNFQGTSTAAALDMTFFLRLVSGTDWMQSRYLLQSLTGVFGQVSTIGVVVIPNMSQNFFYLLAIATGTGPVVSIDVLGYQNPNGGG